MDSQGERVAWLELAPAQPWSDWTAPVGLFQNQRHEQVLKEAFQAKQMNQAEAFQIVPCCYGVVKAQAYAHYFEQQLLLV